VVDDKGNGFFKELRLGLRGWVALDATRYAVSFRIGFSGNRGGTPLLKTLCRTALCWKKLKS
jgi:hypothetical protein